MKPPIGNLFLLLVLAGNPGAGAAGPAQSTFEFHNGFWVNLHHTLYNQAAGRKAGRVPDLAALTLGETAEWTQAIDYYENALAAHDLLELPMIRIGRALAVMNEEDSVRGGEIPQRLAGVLAKAAPVYRAHWWNDHKQRNGEWVAQVTPLIAQYEAILKPALAHTYGTRWPRGRIRVEMSYYTTGKSAYTSLGPTLITVSSWSARNQGAAGLETLFHEAGHSLIQKISNEIARVEKLQRRVAPTQDLWHAVIFYTTGEIVRRSVPALTPYAIQYGMWESTWPGILPVMEKDWKPFIEGKGRLRDSVDRLVADLK